MTLMAPMASGGCLCGAVRYTVNGPLRPVILCHCEQCRRTSGHFVAGTACRPQHLSVDEQGALKWYRSSETAERGFCQECGSSLFWKPDHGEHLSVMAGTLDTPTGLQSIAHIYADGASDYFPFDNELPRFSGDLDVNDRPDW